MKTNTGELMTTGEIQQENKKEDLKIEFKFNRVERPEGFEKEKNDCTVRALSLASNIPYSRVHSAFREVGRKDKHGIRGKKVLQKVCSILNIQAIQVKRSGSVKKLLKNYPKGNLFCLVRSHAFAVIDGVSHDLHSEKQHLKGAWLIQ